MNKPSSSITATCISSLVAVRALACVEVVGAASKDDLYVQASNIVVASPESAGKNETLSELPKLPGH